MGIYIQTNVSSLDVQRNLNVTTENLSKHMEKVSSGYRINHAADDAAGLAISTNLNSNVRALLQAKRNTADGISLVQTAEGGLQEISNVLIRLKELSVQSSSDTVGDTERSYIQKEFGALKDEINRIAYSTEFNGTHLLTGNSPLDPEMNANGNDFPLEIQVGSSYNEAEDSLLARNPVDIIRIPLGDMNALVSGENSLNLGANNDEQGTRVDKKQFAQTSINRVEEAIEKVNSFRANLGSIQNRLTHAIGNTATMVENLQSAKSRILDADYAEESSQVVQMGILQKAGVAVLAQANQIPQMALKLLG
jgi:flagellin